MEWFDNFWSVYSNLVLTLGINALLALSIYLTLSCGLLAIPMRPSWASGPTPPHC